MVSKAGLAGASVLAGVVVLASPMAGSAQYTDVPRPPAYALENVTVVQADGRRTEDVTLVVRGELIEAMGPGVVAPADARVLAGDSLVVYPGLIDGDGDADAELPGADVAQGAVELWNAPRSLQGFMPARRLLDHLTATGRDLEDARQEGIVAAAVHPTGAMMPGRGVFLLHRPDATTPERLVLRPELGPRFELQGAPDVYPATLFGVMAFFRQAFEDARHRGLQIEAFERDPRGMSPPAYDADYAVLREVLDGLPVFFEADDATDILRVLGLADEYGFRPVVVGAGEAWKVADQLRAAGVPVLVSVDFHEPRRWDPESDEPLDAAAEREKRELEDRYANAGRLAEAGVTFALTSGGSGEILDGARKAVEYGLSATDALAALTRTPAELFDLAWLPRLGRGLPATFVVASGPLFAPDTRVEYTFVEGWKEDGETPGTGAGDPEEAVDFGGAWAMTINAQGEILTGTLLVVQEGATFTGTLTLGGDEMELRDGTIDGNEIRVVALMEQAGETLEVEITGAVEGDEALGEADAGPLGVATWTADRTGPGGTP